MITMFPRDIVGGIFALKVQKNTVNLCGVVFEAVKSRRVNNPFSLSPIGQADHDIFPFFLFFFLFFFHPILRCIAFALLRSPAPSSYIWS